MEEADYPGVRVSMETKFDGVITPLKIDISTGDIITPREIKYNFNLMLEDRTIEVWAYNYEINSHININYIREYTRRIKKMVYEK